MRRHVRIFTDTTAPRNTVPGNTAPGLSLADAVGRVAGVAASAAASTVEIERVCPRCGSRDHGKPRILAPVAPNGRPFEASISRTLGFGIVAVTDAGPIGVDVEHPDRVARASIDLTALHPAERDALAALRGPERDIRRTVLWTVKEAVLKATGVGLNSDPSALRVTVSRGRARLDAWPESLGLECAPTITLFAFGGGVVGALAVLGRGRVTTQLSRRPPRSVEPAGEFR